MSTTPKRRRRVSPDAKGSPVTDRLDATVLNRMLSRPWESAERIDLANTWFTPVKDHRSPGFVPLTPIGIRLRDDIREWLVDNDVPFGVHCDLVGEGWPSLDAYLILPNDDQRTLFTLRFGKAA